MRYVVATYSQTPIEVGTTYKMHSNVVINQELSEHEYKGCCNAVSEILDFRLRTQFFLIVGRNYNEYMNAVERWFHHYKSRKTTQLGREPIDFEIMILELNRCLLNFLFSFRACLDYAEIYLKQKHGGDSDIVESFNRCRHRVYETNLSFRLVSHLRNATHLGPPISQFSISSTPKEGSPSETEHTFIVGVSRDYWLKNLDWDTTSRRQFKQELSNLPERIDISLHLKSAMQGLGEIRDKFVEHDLQHLKETAAYLAAILKGFPNVSDNLLLIDLGEPDMKTTPNAMNWTTTSIPVQDIKAILQAPTKP